MKGGNGPRFPTFPAASIASLIAAAAVLVLAGCSEESEKKAPPEPIPLGLTLTKVGFEDLPGWADDGGDGIARALNKSCEAISNRPADSEIGTAAVPMRASDWTDICAAAAAIDADTDIDAMLTTHFTPFAAAAVGNGAGNPPEQGLFTGYFEAEVRGALSRSETYSVPLYGLPDDLLKADLGAFDEALAGHHLVGKALDGRFVPYPARGDIEAGGLAGRGLELYWLDDPVDAFLLHVQGSGRVILPDGGVARVGFAAHNGRRYHSIGRELIDRGELKPHQASWNGIRDWIRANPDKAAALFAVNPRFIFFREIHGDGPIGSLGVALTPERSLAVDRRFVPLGIPVWLDTVMPGSDGAPLRRLMVAQDTGGAIKGPIRGDFFWGYGAPALAQAGRMKSRGRYFLLLPNPAAERQSVPAS